jgi:hypothetical protein
MKKIVFLIAAVSVVEAKSFLDIGSIRDAIISVLLQIIADGLNIFISLANFFIATNPYLTNDVLAIHSKLITLLAPLYVLILTWNGIQIMLSRGISSQTNAKSVIQKTIISILLVASSLQIYQLILNLSQAISSFFLVNSLPDFGAPSISTIALFALAFFFLTLFVIFLIVRFIFISLGVVIFPIGIFLYFFTPTKAYGKLLLSIIFLFLFIQILFALVISVMTIVASTPPQAGFVGITEQTYKLAIFLGGLFVLILVPVLLILQIITVALFPEIKLFGILGGGFAREQPSF